ncbi:MAG: phosphatase PAP2 family protein [Eubacterium sp.]|nr:phosphatase PAP2 family protein [Eubacterium sp.]
MLKKYRPYIIVYFILFAISLTVASFVDLKLDIALNNPDSPFSKWFEATGEMPCRLIGTVAGVLIYKLCDKKAFKLFGIFVNFASSAYLGYHIASYFFKEENYIVFGLVYGIGIGVTAQYLIRYISIPEKLKKPLIILSFTGIAVMLVQLGAIEITKSLWGRIRYRDLIKMPSFEAFTPWYKPNGINGNRSFPSGHTAGAAMSYLMMTLPYASEKWEKRKAMCFAVPLVYTSIVAYTRLVMGAHFLSDVSVGGTIGFVTVIIAMAVLDKKFFNKK